MTPDARIADLVVSFALELEAQAKAPRTVKLYTQSVRLFCDWLELRDRPATVAELTRPAVRAWLAELTKVREQQPGTVRLRAKGLQRFTRWAVAEGELDADPMDGVDVQPAPAKPVPVFTDAEVQRLMRSCAGGTFQDRRDEAMMRILLDCGVRVSELTGLTVDGVNLRERFATVVGKGSKHRAIYFHRSRSGPLPAGASAAPAR